MLEIITDQEPNIFFEDESKRAFKFFTIITQGERHFRIVKETNLGFFNYDFIIDLTGLENGQPFTFKIPYFRDKFIDSRINNPTKDRPVLNGNFGDYIDEGIYKLLYISSSNNKEIPSQTRLNEVYTAGLNKRYKILYYKVIDNKKYFLGYLGNRYLENEPYPFLSIDTEKDFDNVIDSEIHHYFVKINSTPNVIISDLKTKIKTFFDIYSRDEYTYKLSSPGNGIRNIEFIFNLEIENSVGEKVKNLNNFKIEHTNETESSNAQPTIKIKNFLPPNEYNTSYLFYAITNHYSVSFRIYGIFD